MDNRQLKLTLALAKRGLFLVAGSILLSPFFLNEKVIAQTNNPSPGNIVSDGIKGQQAVTEALNQMWDDILTSGVWDAMVWVATFFVTGLIALWVVLLVKDSLENELSSEYFSAFFWLFLVLLLLLNQGSLLRDVVLGFRAIINHTNEEVLAVQVKGVTLEDSFNKIITANTFDSWYQQEKSRCEAEAKPELKQKCWSELDTKKKEYEQQLAAQKKSNGGLFQGFKDSIGDGLQRLLELWMLGMGIAFQWLVEITLLLTALLAPLAVAGSLLPLKQRPLFTWLTGFYSVGLCKLFYNIIVGLVAHILSHTTTSGNPSGGTIIFAMAVGVLAPILAVALAAGGGMTTLMSIGSLASLAGGAAAGAGMGAAAGVAGMTFGAAKGAIGNAMSKGGEAGGARGGGGRPRYSSGGRPNVPPQLPPASSLSILK